MILKYIQLSKLKTPLGKMAGIALKGQCDLDFIMDEMDEMHTVLVEVENILNSRPITHTYNECDVEVLTPSHLMCGKRLSPVADNFDHKYDLDDDEQTSLAKGLPI